MNTSGTLFTPSQNRQQTAFSRAMLAVGKLVDTDLKTPLDEVRLTQSGIAPEAVDVLKGFGASLNELS